MLPALMLPVGTNEFSIRICWIWAGLSPSPITANCEPVSDDTGLETDDTRRFDCVVACLLQSRHPRHQIFDVAQHPVEQISSDQIARRDARRVQDIELRLERILARLGQFAIERIEQDREALRGIDRSAFLVPFSATSAREGKIGVVPAVEVEAGVGAVRQVACCEDQDGIRAVRGRRWPLPRRSDFQRLHKARLLHLSRCGSPVPSGFHAPVARLVRR